jgi:hypothetical protein
MSLTFFASATATMFDGFGALEIQDARLLRRRPAPKPRNGGLI